MACSWDGLGFGLGPGWDRVKRAARIGCSQARLPPALDHRPLSHHSDLRLQNGIPQTTVRHCNRIALLFLTTKQPTERLRVDLDRPGPGFAKEGGTSASRSCGTRPAARGATHISSDTLTCTLLMSARLTASRRTGHPCQYPRSDHNHTPQLSPQTDGCTPPRPPARARARCPTS